ncbi:MAG: hypothetical protein JW923_04970 [Spirochaetales bacterium]|nr:hypothetical protein [Spirochaetales bacterium]
MIRRVLALAMTSTLLLLGAHADGVRTVVAAIVVVDPANPDGQEVTLGYNEAVAVTVPEGVMFLDGVEFELRLPKAVQGSESALAWSVYAGVRPDPDLSLYDYEGEQLAVQNLPARVSLALRLPFVANNSLRPSPFYVLLPTVVGAERYPVLFKLLAIGKGISRAVESARFTLVVKPVLSGDGAIVIDLASGLDGVDIKAFLDDKPVDDPRARVVIRKGLHTLRIQAAGYQEEVVSVTVEPGKVLSVPVSLVPDVPRLSIQAPQGSVISLDGKALAQADWESLVIEVGEHTVSCRIGDHTISRKFTAQRGVTYTLVLSLELTIQSTP